MRRGWRGACTHSHSCSPPPSRWVRVRFSFLNPKPQRRNLRGVPINNLTRASARAHHEPPGTRRQHSPPHPSCRGLPSRTVGGGVHAPLSDPGAPLLQSELTPVLPPGTVPSRRRAHREPHRACEHSSRRWRPDTSRRRPPARARCAWRPGTSPPSTTTPSSTTSRTTTPRTTR